MKNILILIYIFHVINAELNTSNICRNCLGKIHTYKDLELAKEPLIINKNNTCQNEKFKFFIIVKSGDFQRRNFTRYTWAKEIIEHFNVPVLYAIGYPNDSSIQKDIISEDEIYHDLLQFNILESYYNLTIKTISALYWYNQYCSNNSNYLLYIDDDILIHVDKLIMYISQIKYNDTIEGWFEKSEKIQRTGIGGISKEDFPIDIVPDYLWGAAVLYPSNIISNVLINAIFNTSIPIFFRDDIFINGFISEQAGIKRQYMKGILLYDNTADDLKTNIIIIDFKNEKDREKAWNCYKYNIQCNKNFKLIIFKILFEIFLLIIIIIYCCKWFITTNYYNELNIYYNTIFNPYEKKFNSISMKNRYQGLKVGNQQIKLGIPRLFYLRRTYIRIILILIIILMLYYLIDNKSFLY